MPCHLCCHLPVSRKFPSSLSQKPGWFQAGQSSLWPIRPWEGVSRRLAHTEHHVPVASLLVVAELAHSDSPGLLGSLTCPQMRLACGCAGPVLWHWWHVRSRLGGAASTSAGLSNLSTNPAAEPGGAWPSPLFYGLVSAFQLQLLNLCCLTRIDFRVHAGAISWD